MLRTLGIGAERWILHKILSPGNEYRRRYKED